MDKEKSVPICLRCKKISYELKKTGVTIDDISKIIKEKLVTKIINKPYHSIGHLSKSRLGEKDHHIDIGQEKLLTEKFPPIECILYLEEKMDGSNVSVIRKEGEIIAVGRSGYGCKESNQEQHRRFAKFVEDNKEKFEQLLPNENDRVVGEWMALAHGTLYKDLPSPFMAFELYYGKEAQNDKTRRAAFKEVKIEQVPLLAKTTHPISIEKALEIANKHRSNCEGVVYRLERFDNKKDNYVPWIIAKIVKQDKVDGFYFDKDNPIWL